ncbi:hypothetical protein J6590_000753, partial [Homalodisca vitripennis]
RRHGRGCRGGVEKPRGGDQYTSDSSSNSLNASLKFTANDNTIAHCFRHHVGFQALTL